MSEIAVSGSALYGLPHIGATYLPGWKGKKRNYGRVSEICEACCRARATSTHHIVPIGMGGRQSARTIFVNPVSCDSYNAEHVQSPEFMATGMGRFEVYTPLIAVCGTGTIGCHGDFEEHRIGIEWVWRDALCKNLWESGWILSHGYKPNSERLYEFGYYRISGRSGILREIGR